MKILVIGGMHGNEMLGIELVNLLMTNPIESVDTLIANPRAVQQSVRYVETDLNRSFTKRGTSYEYNRAQELCTVVMKYDLVLDFHNTQAPNNNCGFVGEECDEVLYRALAMFDITNCIEATYDCINQACKNVVSIEVSTGDVLDGAHYWYEAIKNLNARLAQVEVETQLSIYKFLRRVTWAEKEMSVIDPWEPFASIAEESLRQLSINLSDKEVVPIFIGSRLTEYYATLLTKERTISL